MSLFPVLVLFNVFKFHDYYYITQIPYIVAIAACGMVSALESTPKTRWAFAIILVSLMAWRLSKFESTFGVLFSDGGEYVQLAKWIQDSTDPSERIVLPTEPDSWWLPLYSKREIVMEYHLTRPEHYDRFGVSVLALQSPDEYLMRGFPNRVPASQWKGWSLYRRTKP
jgi:hypothetical protein